MGRGGKGVARTDHVHVGGGQVGAEKRTHSNHLDMALLEPALDAVEIGGVEVVAVVGLLHDIVVNGALFEGA